MATKPAQSQSDEDRKGGDSFWDQWGTTSLADVRRDTYGSEKRSALERELRSDAE
jgi:hypothetical protein